jgi:hypothetical protein
VVVLLMRCYSLHLSGCSGESERGVWSELTSCRRSECDRCSTHKRVECEWLVGGWWVVECGAVDGLDGSGGGSEWSLECASAAAVAVRILVVIFQESTIVGK